MTRCTQRIVCITKRSTDRLLLCIAVLVFLLHAPGVTWAQGRESARKKTPVILSTDIGDDIDDTWALGFLLRCPEVDVKLVIGDNGHPELRGKLLAKFLERTGYAHVPVGLGVDVENPISRCYQAGWVDDYKLESFSGAVHRDGVQTMIDLIMNSGKEPITVIAVGPMPNIAEALKREPRIAQRSRLVGMYGSIQVGYFGAMKPVKESNVVRDVPSCQQSLTAPWDVAITPLDTCGSVRITGEKYRRILNSNDPVAKTIVENYRLREIARGAGDDHNADKRSTILFDVAAIGLAFDESYFNTETLGVRVTNDGFTRLDPGAKQMEVAMSWRDLPGFVDMVVERLAPSE